MTPNQGNLTDVKVTIKEGCFYFFSEFFSEF